MEEVIFASVAIALLLPFIFAWHLKRATHRLKIADRAWGSLEQHAHTLMEDRHLNPLIGDFVERVLMRIGDGSLTRRFLLFIIFRPKSKANSSPEWKEALRSMEAGQEKQFTHFLVDAIFYDSLRTTFSGSVLRRVVLYWLESTARDESAPVSRQQVKPITFAANRAFRAA